MLQASITIEKVFEHGITPICLFNKNQEFLTQALNCRPYFTGFNAVPQIPQVHVPSNNCQSFEIGAQTYIFDTTEIYKIDGDNSLTLLLNGIPAGGRWWYADLQVGGLFVNGVVTLLLSQCQFSVYQTGPHFPQFSALINFNGQLIGCGITDGWQGCDESSVAWSTIGKSFNFLPDQSNIQGYRSLNELGVCLGLYELRTYQGSSVVVVCSRGCAELFPAEMTFGRKDVKDARGARDQWSHGASGDAVYSIDRAGNLSIIGIDYGSFQRKLLSKVLGWSDNLNNKTTRLFYLRSTDETHIASLEDNLTYVINEQGMYALNGYICSASDKTQLRYYSQTPVSMTDMIFTDSIRDFKDQGLKQITEISIGADTLDTCIEVSVAARQDVRKPLISGPWIPLNEFLACKFVTPVTGVEFQISVKVSNYSSIKTFAPDWMKIQYLKLDRRFNRGHDFSGGQNTVQNQGE